MLRKLATIIILTSCVAISGTASIKSDKNRIKDREQKIEKQLSSMSLEQKIGQMVQLEVNMITQFDQRYTVTALQKLSVKELSDIISKFDLTNEYDATLMVVSNGKPKSSNDYQYQCLSQAINYKLGFKLDKTKLQNVFQTYRVGSILNMLGGTCASEVDVWNKATNTIQEAALKYSGIPMVYGLDQLHGTTYTAKGTLFPHQIGMVATFNPELAKRMGEISAYETRACGVRWLFSPSMDICRKPSWPRLYESMGEDPYAASVMGEAYLKGLQGDDPNNIDEYHVGTCLKHYFGYGVPDNGIDRTPANVNEQDLREKLFTPFLKAFQNGAIATMTNSSILNGMNGVANKKFLQQWLKDDLEWDGLIVTDWGDIENLYIRDHIAASQKDAIRMAINAGVDMMMVPSQLNYGETLKQLVEDGCVAQERIDDAVRRILRLKYRLNLFDNPYSNDNKYPLFGSAAHAAVAKQMAVESEILLKNEDNILPLQHGKKILLCGPNANTMRGLNGGWSYSWQGNNVEKFSEQYNTILEAMTNKFGSDNIIFEPGVAYEEHKEWTAEDASGIEKAVAQAKDVDYIIACVGENSYAETTGNISDLNLSSNQKLLVKRLQDTGKPVILILNEGRPRLIHDLVDGCKAIVNIMLPGNYGGDALADLLSGDENFSGRLPFTYPSHPNSFTTYDFKVCEARETMPGTYNYEAHTNTQWWFGEGMSYTTFEYSNLEISKSSFDAGDILEFSIMVKNTGNRKGKETVMLYSQDLSASIIPDNRRLRNFKKIELTPGESQTASFSINAKDLAFIGSDGKWHLEKGEYKITVGNQATVINCVSDFTSETNILN